jgi:hypothetical protein
MRVELPESSRVSVVVDRPMRRIIAVPKVRTRRGAAWDSRFPLTNIKRLQRIARDDQPGYNRASHMPRRRELAQDWADMLLKDAPDAAMLVHGPRRG